MWQYGDRDIDVTSDTCKQASNTPTRTAYWVFCWVSIVASETDKQPIVMCVVAGREAGPLQNCTQGCHFKCYRHLQLLSEGLRVDACKPCVWLTNCAAKEGIVNGCALHLWLDLEAASTTCVSAAAACSTV